MPADVEQATERTKLLYQVANDRRLSTVLDEDAHSVITSHVSKAEQALGKTPIGERLPYNDYTTIDWLHDLASSCAQIQRNTTNVNKVKDSFRARSIRREGIRGRLTSSFESCQGWIAVALIGVLTACVAFLVDVAEATTLPATAPGHGDKHHGPAVGGDQGVTGKSMYMAAGSGIPEIKTILSGFVIPHFLDLKVLIVKAIGAVFAVASAYLVGQQEADPAGTKYLGWLVYGTVSKLLLTTITFGCKVPSGVIIPALDAGAFFGRLIGQWITNISPGIFAMVGAVAFLAGVCRMTISLCVIMFELTGELEYIVPNMIAILVAKWVADALEREGVYDLAQTVLGHPFLDLDHAMKLVQAENEVAGRLIPPKQTMLEITVDVPKDNTVSRKILEQKLDELKSRGLMDAGLVLVQDGLLQGYLSEGELDFGLNELGKVWDSLCKVRLLGDPQEGEFDLSMFVDRTPLTICAKAPMEYAVEMFGKLGLRYLCVVEEGTGRLVGVILKKRLVVWLEGLKE
ncbi:MAG: hypothetical protein Q9195_003899 [Heterodermia aff. obscurata]